MHQGGCACGAVRYEAGEETVRVTHCHCLDCRRSSGAPLLTWAEFPVGEFRFIKGEPREYSLRDGTIRTFCPDCGSQLTFVDDDQPAVVDVSVGTLDYPSVVEPEDHVWNSRRLPWLPVNDGLPVYDKSRRHE